MNHDKQVQVDPAKTCLGKRRAYIFAGALGVGFSIATAGSQIWQNPFSLVGSIVSLFGLVVVSIASFVMALKCWRFSFFSWLGPGVLCVGFLAMFPVTQWIGRNIANAMSKSSLQRYSLVVDDIKNAKIAVPETLSDITLKVMPEGVKSIKAVRRPDGSAIVIFVTGTGFPLHHAGYVFDGCGTNVDCITEFNAFSNKVSLQKEFGQWYHFSD